MADTYKAWLEEQVAYYTNVCMEDVAKMGRPGQIRFANQVYREILETYEECLDKHNELAALASPALPTSE